MPSLRERIQAQEALVARLRAELGSPEERRAAGGEAAWQAIESADLLGQVNDIFQRYHILTGQLEDALDEAHGPWVIHTWTGFTEPLREFLERRRRLCKLFGAEYPKEWASEEKRWQRELDNQNKDIRMGERFYQRRQQHEARDIAGWDDPLGSRTAPSPDTYPAGRKPPA